MVGWLGAIRTLVALLGDSPGAQPYPSSNATTLTQTANYNASFGETVICDATAGGFTVTLPLITAISKWSQIRILLSGSPSLDGAHNITIAPNAANSIGGSALNTSILLSGHSTIVLESNGGTGWIITVTPACPSTLATFADANQTLTRQGPITLGTANAVTAAGRTYTFSGTGAVAGDIFYLAIPTHGANTITVKNAATTTIATYAATIAGGGAFIFNGGDWQVMQGGPSTT